jgi:hypothetical protein
MARSTTQGGGRGARKSAAPPAVAPGSDTTLTRAQRLELY